MMQGGITWEINEHKQRSVHCEASYVSVHGNKELCLGFKKHHKTDLKKKKIRPNTKGGLQVFPVRHTFVHNKIRLMGLSLLCFV